MKTIHRKIDFLGYFIAEATACFLVINLNLVFTAIKIKIFEEKNNSLPWKNFVLEDPFPIFHEKLRIHEIKQIEILSKIILVQISWKMTSVGVKFFIMRLTCTGSPTVTTSVGVQKSNSCPSFSSLKVKWKADVISPPVNPVFVSTFWWKLVKSYKLS